ncbi:MAG: hypothetical protein ACLQU2_31235 [Candidatus Binataceae bacterium]
MFRINADSRASRVLSLLAVMQFIVQVTGTAANAAPTPQEVHFKRGESFAILQGTLKGWDLKEYSLRANKGQRLRLQVTSRRINTLIVRLYPGNQASGDNDLLNSDNTNTFEWEGPLPISGEYVLRLFIRRAKARRGGSVDYRVKLAIEPGEHPQ